jgi:hypothetical protein
MDFPSTASLATALALTASANLFAQEGLPVAPGDRVRVAAPNIVRELMTERQRRSLLGPPPPIYGSVVAIRADTLVVKIQGSDAPTAFPVSSVTKLEVSRGKKSNAGRGALIGGTVFAALALGLGIADMGRECPPPEPGNPFAGFWCEETEIGHVVAATLVCGGLGAGLGALIGWGAKSDRWEEVPLDGLRISLTPQGRDRLRVSVSLRL